MAVPSNHPLNGRSKMARRRRMSRKLRTLKRRRMGRSGKRDKKAEGYGGKEKRRTERPRNRGREEDNAD